MEVNNNLNISLYVDEKLSINTKLGEIDKRISATSITVLEKEKTIEELSSLKSRLLEIEKNKNTCLSKVDTLQQETLQKQIDEEETEKNVPYTYDMIDWIELKTEKINLDADFAALKTDMPLFLKSPSAELAKTLIYPLHTLTKASSSTNKREFTKWLNEQIIQMQPEHRTALLQALVNSPEARINRSLAAYFYPANTVESWQEYLFLFLQLKQLSPDELPVNVAEQLSYRLEQTPLFIAALNSFNPEDRQAIIADLTAELPRQLYLPLNRSELFTTAEQLQHLCAQLNMPLPPKLSEQFKHFLLTANSETLARFKNIFPENSELHAFVEKIQQAAYPEYSLNAAQWLNQLIEQPASAKELLLEIGLENFTQLINTFAAAKLTEFKDEQINSIFLACMEAMPWVKGLRKESNGHIGITAEGLQTIMQEWLNSHPIAKKVYLTTEPSDFHQQFADFIASGNSYGYFIMQPDISMQVHYAPVIIHRTESRNYEILSLDSTGQYAYEIYETLKNEGITGKLYYSTLSRQGMEFVCALFACKDIRKAARNPEAFFAHAATHATETLIPDPRTIPADPNFVAVKQDPELTLFRLNKLPPALMATNQSITALTEYLLKDDENEQEGLEKDALAKKVDDKTRIDQYLQRKTNQLITAPQNKLLADTLYKYIARLITLDTQSRAL